MADAAVSFLLSNLFDLVKHYAKNIVSSNSNSNSAISVDFVDELKLVDQIQRVPSLFRNSQSHKNAYDPVIVSIGPYHHGRKQYAHAQAFKQRSLDTFVSESHNNNEAFYHGKILERIGDIRLCYEELDEYTNEDLAMLILRDACFVIYHLQSLTKQTDSWKDKFAYSYTYFGPARLKFIVRDLLLLENQIPSWIIEHLLCSSLGDQGKYIWKDMLCKFVDEVIFGQVEDAFHLNPRKNNDAFHLLGAYYQALKVQIPVQQDERPTPGISISGRNARKSHSYRFRSITNLKAKGIRLKQSKTHISFVSHSLYGSLELPPLVFPTNFFVLYANLIAYEISPTGQTDFFVSSLVNLMKSLIESPNDVKILREKGILFSDMVSDDEVVNVIKDLDTFGLENAGTFLQLRMDIEKHCCSKAKTWAAELIHANFESPWKAIALLAAIILLCLTFLQTFFTIHPAK